MDMTHTYWEENSNIQRVKFERCITNEEPVRMKDDRTIYPCYDSNLNFSTATCSEDDCEFGPYKKSKVARQDPMSHRIIEKRRRDRMNNCLADLSRLIPTEYLKKGRGRIEKTEIIEMAIKHMKHLQSQERGSPMEHYRLGYQECMSEAMRFLVEVEGHFPREPICVRLLNHLQKHGEEISKGSGNFERAFPPSPPHEPVSSFPAQVPSLIKGANQVQTKASEFTVPKAEPENSNSNDAHPNEFVMRNQKSDEFEKDLGNSGMSYKYKTNIKLRFCQDVNAHEVPKRQKLEERRRNSITSFENQSSNQSSPPSSEPCMRISDTENVNRQTPPEVSIGSNQHKVDAPRNDVAQRFSPSLTTQTHDKNFNVPIFVLHTKGSYYVPLVIDYNTLLPYLQNYSLVDPLPPPHNIVLHPVTINVNFSPNFNGDLKNNNKLSYEYNNNWH